MPPTRAFPRLTRTAGGEETAAISSSKLVVPTVTKTDFMATRGGPQRDLSGGQEAARERCRACRGSPKMAAGLRGGSAPLGPPAPHSLPEE